ncbi:copper amine oxidase N-terminal domain-containing protein [Gorillibacterium timonense]|uniref:copper amine oxidase N-terminal domain-containing protein n=1 Tax=Gorillibacterium timonense TaxID=1689269 RepID=UPI00071CF59D|nr:copper amine oxidase N-terminal domain-containing protein [Gorillibacterium timonense]
MLKKKILTLMAALLAFSGSAGAVYAKQEDPAKGKKETSAPGKNQAPGKVEVKLPNDQESTVTSVTYTTYGNGKSNGNGKGPQGYKGLLNAIENVKDKPAGAVIAEILLSQYGDKLTAEQKAKLEAIVAKDEALTAAADLLAKLGSVTEAVYVQKEAIKVNVTNINSYKKLGKLYEKLGKKGIKLYVNGDELAFKVAPYVRGGSTLVPFRVIAEALNAQVTWNAADQSVTVSRDGITVKLVIGKTTAYVNGKKVNLAVAAEVKAGTTLVPVRFISESLKANVNWEGESQSVIINE